MKDLGTKCRLLQASFLIHENHHSNYRSSNEFHFDFLIAHHFSPLFAVGLPAYWYKQVTGDNGSLRDGSNFGSFRGESGRPRTDHPFQADDRGQRRELHSKVGA